MFLLSTRTFRAEQNAASPLLSATLPRGRSAAVVPLLDAWVSERVCPGASACIGDGLFVRAERLRNHRAHLLRRQQRSLLLRAPLLQHVAQAGAAGRGIGRAGRGGRFGGASMASSFSTSRSTSSSWPGHQTHHAPPPHTFATTRHALPVSRSRATAPEWRVRCVGARPASNARCSASSEKRRSASGLRTCATRCCGRQAVKTHVPRRLGRPLPLQYGRAC